MTDPNIKVSFGSLEALSADIGVQVAAIEGNIETLRTQIQSVEDAWGGDASQGFNATQKQWEVAANDLRGVLARIKIAVETSTNGYQDAENRNKVRWDQGNISGIR